MKIHRKTNGTPTSPSSTTAPRGKTSNSAREYSSGPSRAMRSETTRHRCFMAVQGNRAPAKQHEKRRTGTQFSTHLWNSAPDSAKLRPSLVRLKSLARSQGLPAVLRFSGAASLGRLEPQPCQSVQDMSGLDCMDDLGTKNSSLALGFFTTGKAGVPDCKNCSLNAPHVMWLTYEGDARFG